LKTYR